MIQRTLPAGGWFFLAASEAISVLNQQYTLPGIGSYVAAAVSAQNMPALGYAVLTMAVVIVGIDQIFWRPVVAWSDKFRLEQSAAAEAPQSWVYDLIRQSRASAALERFVTPAGDALTALFSSINIRAARAKFDERRARVAERVYTVLLGVVVTGLAVLAAHFISRRSVSPKSAASSAWVRSRCCASSCC
jgi:NitT/TauT family transport system permease protein